MPTWLCHVGDVCVLFICHKPEGGKNGKASDKTGAAVQETQVHTVPERKGQKSFSHVQRNASNKQGSCLFFIIYLKIFCLKWALQKGEALTFGSHFPLTTWEEFYQMMQRINVLSSHLKHVFWTLFCDQLHCFCTILVCLILESTCCECALISNSVVKVSFWVEVDVTTYL